MTSGNDARSAGYQQVLLTRLRNGEERAFESLVQIYGGSLIAHASRIVGAVELGREVVQEVFFSLWLQRERIEPTWDIGAYLYGLTRQRSIDAIRSERSSSDREYRWITDHLAEKPDQTDGTDSPGEINEARAAVWNALLELTPRCREVFVLVMDHQLGYPEVARTLGLSETTVRRHMSRALEHLAEILGPGLTSDSERPPD